MLKMNFWTLMWLAMTSLFFAVSGIAHATTYTFVGGFPSNETNWFIPENWSPNGVPGAADTAIISKSTPGAITAQFGSAVTVANLTISNADSTLSGIPGRTLTVTNAFNWTAGATQQGTIIVSSGGHLNFSGSLPKTIGGALYNQGTATWSGTGAIVMFEESSDSAFINSGTLDIQNNSALENPRFQFGVCSVTNTGTITKSAGGGLSKFNHVRFNSSGGVSTININSGSLELHGLVTSNGPINVAANSFLNLAEGSYRFDSFNSFNGAGKVRVFNSENLANGGTAAIDASGFINLTGTFDFIGTSDNDGALNIRTTGDTLDIFGTGTFNWTGGKFVQGTLNIGSDIKWNISGAATKGIQGTNFNNAGIMNWTGTGNIYPLDSIFTNTGTFNVQTDADIGGFNGSMTLNNSGTFAKSASSGLTQIGSGGSSVTLNNSGTLYVNSGTLEVDTHGGGTHSGLFSVASGTTLQFAGDSNALGVALNNGTTFSGAGLVRIGFPIGGIVMSGAATVNCTLEIDGSLQNQGSNTTLSLSGSGPVNWIDGEINGVLNIATGTPFNISGTSADRQLMGTINNSGIATWSGTGLMRLSGTFNNNSVFLVQNNEEFGGAFTQGKFNNSGTFLKTGGTGTTTIGNGAGLAFNNSGTVVVRSGTLSVPGTLTQTVGATVLQNANISVGNPFALKGGSLSGIGTITGGINNSGGSVSPGFSPGTMTEIGDYVQGANGALGMEINSAPPTTQDHLDVTGAVSLGGTLHVSLGFTPAIGTTFNLINNDGTDAVTGTFAGLPQGALLTANNVPLQIAYNGGDGNDVTLTRIASPTLSINDITITEGDIGTKNANFTITLSFASPQTVNVGAIPANGTAKSPADYTGNGQSFTFAPGQTSKTFTVPVLGDTLDEDVENFFVLLSSPVNATILKGRGTCTIADHDTAPTITIEDVNIGEGNAGQRTAVFRLHLSAPSGKLVKVNYATAAGNHQPRRCWCGLCRRHAHANRLHYRTNHHLSARSHQWRYLERKRRNLQGQSQRRPKRDNL